MWNSSIIRNSGERNMYCNDRVTIENYQALI